MKTIKISLIALVALAAIACQPAQKTGVKHVFLIGLDGMSSVGYSMADMPFVKGLSEEGSYTVKKRSVLESSSAINWAAMFMGVPTELHGYTSWGSRFPEIKERFEYKNNIFPTMFQLTRDRYPDAEIGCIYDWDGIKYLVDTLSLSYHAQTPSLELENMTRMASEYIKAKKPLLAAFIFDQPDHVGHQNGWATTDYNAILHQMDSCVQQIVEAIKEAGIYDESVIIVTADHGGVNGHHGGISPDEMETPFIIAGPGIRKGVCFDDYSMMQYDIASTILKILDVEQPQIYVGRPVAPALECCDWKPSDINTASRTILFNGSDLTGWVPVIEAADGAADVAAAGAQQDVFTVSDGVISVKGNPFGYLRTEKKYGDYFLHVQWRWVGEGTNSGIFQRVQDGDKVWAPAIECQLHKGDAGDFVCLGGARIAEVQAGPEVKFPVKERIAQSAVIERPDGEWNTAEIICRGKSIKVYVNGSFENECTYDETEGYIALQSEGGPLEFRDIYVINM